MAQPVILVVFYSRCGATEKTALEAALGAVQARALIRFRRVSDIDPANTLRDFAECKETILRMHKEYVAPAEADLRAADGLVFAAPPGLTAASAEWRPVLELLSGLSSRGELDGKAAAVLNTGDASTVLSFSEMLMKLGLTIVADPLRGALAHGRRIAAVAEALKV